MIITCELNASLDSVIILESALNKTLELSASFNEQVVLFASLDKIVELECDLKG